MIDLADRMMLASVQIALETPFRDPVRVAGQLMPRQIERQLLRLRVLERQAYPAPSSPDPSIQARQPGRREGEGFPPVARALPAASSTHVHEATNG